MLSSGAGGADRQERLQPLASLPLLAVCGATAGERERCLSLLRDRLQAEGLEVARQGLSRPWSSVQAEAAEMAEQSRLEGRLHGLCQRFDLVLVESAASLPLPYLWLEGGGLVSGVHGAAQTSSGRALVWNSAQLVERVRAWLGQQWQQTPLWGCVLIGGKSRRMGRAKHLISRQGHTWVERGVQVLSRQVEQVVVSGTGELPDSLRSLERVEDVAGLGGPIAGILAVMRHRPEVSWLVVACDLPEMDERALQWLLAARGPGVHGVLPDLNGNGMVEPLLAYYDFRARSAVEAIVAGGSLRINRLKSAPGIITPQPPAELRRSWRNVNTPEELANKP
ncbi:molybdenum cofactor guanylyltransferase [Desulfogranum mediterraneum]|uniref:molybdenum cofactor guanylyltransferase n=1 Tax=Desulfogranum mediterraneum TaxID=160661 RepID=UPI00041ABDBE|nr:molybdenum cofactor guanylyltransferase [Desulfogranum mediterraneum]